MKKITLNSLLTIVIIALFTNCEGKKNPTAEQTEHTQQLDSLNIQKNEEAATIDHNKQDVKLIYNSYDFAESLKADSFFESDNIDKTVELEDVGITTYFVSGDKVTLNGVCYKNGFGLPRYENNPPGRAFVPDYYGLKEIKYDEKYKSSYSVTLRITLKNPRDVKKLKMYIAAEPVLNYEYKVEGNLDEYRSGFIDLINIKGIFKGLNPDSVYPNKNYEIENAEIK